MFWQTASSTPPTIKLNRSKRNQRNPPVSEPGSTQLTAAPSPLGAAPTLSPTAAWRPGGAHGAPASAKEKVTAAFTFLFPELQTSLSQGGEAAQMPALINLNIYQSHFFFFLIVYVCALFVSHKIPGVLGVPCLQGA